jgi:hypothetical protein
MTSLLPLSTLNRTKLSFLAEGVLNLAADEDGGPV